MVAKLECPKVKVSVYLQKEVADRLALEAKASGGYGGKSYIVEQALLQFFAQLKLEDPETVQWDLIQNRLEKQVARGHKLTASQQVQLIAGLSSTRNGRMGRRTNPLHVKSVQGEPTSRGSIRNGRMDRVVDLQGDKE